MSRSSFQPQTPVSGAPAKNPPKRASKADSGVPALGDNLAEAIASLTPAQREAFLSRLPYGAATRVQEILAEHATDTAAYTVTLLPHQVIPPPEEIEEGHLLAGGRGTGKTLGVAFYLARLAERTPGLRARVIAPTLADAVNAVALDPQSGILAHSPSARYVASGAEGVRVVWPNKAVVFLVGTPTLKDVDRLRALTNIDCVARETQVRMADGSTQRAEHVVPGDWVQTRKGPRLVLATRLTEPKRLYKLQTDAGRVLYATGDHLVATSEQQWANMSSLDEGQEVEAWQHNESICTEAFGTSGRTGTTATARLNCFTERFTDGKLALSRQGTSSTLTTLTGTSQTTRPITYSCYPLENMYAKREVPSKLPKLKRHSAALCGTFGEANSPKTLRVRSVENSFHTVTTPLSVLSSAPPRVRLGIITPDERAQDSGTLNVSFVETRSAQRGTLHMYSGGRRVTDRVQQLSRTERVEPTVDLTVEDCPEFIANGVVVHNCDAFEEAAANPQLAAAVTQAALSRRGNRLHHPIWIGATTPRPTPAFKAWLQNPRVKVVSATTADNPHTPQAYRDYAESLRGTRMYRQEVLGEVLADVEGALWGMADVERSIVVDSDARRALLQYISRCAVAVDPATGGGTVGIIVLGVTDAERDPLGFSRLVVLDDFSVTEASPNTWGQRVISAYMAYGFLAPIVVAEKNQGGLMVESTILTAVTSSGLENPVPVTLVTSMVSKERRATPIALLWEVDPQRAVIAPPNGDRNRISLLTDQLTDWVPGAYSPDRLDALTVGAVFLTSGPVKERGELMPPVVSSAARNSVQTSFRRALRGGIEEKMRALRRQNKKQISR